jgi:hypothetical protein
LDPEVAMFQDETVSAEAQQRHFGQVLVPPSVSLV